MSRFTPSVAPERAAGGVSTTAVPTELILGIDFGTSATKIAFREFGGVNSYLVTPPDAMAWPSVVRLLDGQLWFASEAIDGLPDSLTIRWLKMLLAEEGGADWDRHKDEMRRWIGESGCSIQCLSTLYLAHLIGQAKRCIRVFYAELPSPGPQITINMGAPLETFAVTAAGEGGSVATDGFLQVLYWADKLADASPAYGGWSVALAKEAFQAVASQYPRVPPESDRHVFVVPETHAAVTGAVMDRRRLASGNYVVVDIGAGTTDVAVFSYHDYARKEGRWAVTYLADAVKHEASIQADRCIEELIWEAMYLAGQKPPLDAEMLERARVVKERSLRENPVTLPGGIRLNRDSIAKSVEDLRVRLFKHYKKTVISAFRDKTLNGLQGPYHLLLLGGGSRFVPFREQFLNNPPDQNYPRLRPVEIWGSLKDRLRIVSPKGLVRDAGGDDYQMYSLVHGLTTHIVRQANFWSPHEVDDFPAPPAADRNPYLRNDDT